MPVDILVTSTLACTCISKRNHLRNLISACTRPYHSACVYAQEYGNSHTCNTKKYIFMNSLNMHVKKILYMYYPCFFDFQ